MARRWRQRGLGVELGEHHDVVAVHQARHGRGERGVVVQRAGHDVAPVAAGEQRRLASVSTTPGSPDRISFGRPVEPPEVGAFHVGDDAVGERRRR